jgi:hypothetical protein
MSFFKKKKDKQTEQDLNKLSEQRDQQGKNTNRSAYRIHIWESFGSGGMPRKVKPAFIAYRFADEDELIPYLKNEDQKFFEIFPQQIKDFIDDTKDNIQKKLKQTEDKLKKERELEEPNVNFKDLEHQIRKYKAQLRSFDISHNASYGSLGDDNIIEFNYLRVGSSLLPVKWDLETKQIVVPSDNKRKSATIALRNKEAKYPTADNQVKFTSWLFLVLTLLAFLGTSYIGYKQMMTYDENEINEIRTNMLQNTLETTNNIKSQSESISKIADKLNSQLKADEVTVVEGRDTKKFNQS